MSSFENFGEHGALAAETRMECGICWHVYDPAEGDAVWCFVDYEQQASFKILWVKYETQADLKVHKVKYAEQAGWRTSNHKLRGKLG